MTGVAGSSAGNRAPAAASAAELGRSSAAPRIRYYGWTMEAVAAREALEARHQATEATSTEN